MATADQATILQWTASPMSGSLPLTPPASTSSILPGPGSRSPSPTPPLSSQPISTATPHSTPQPSTSSAVTPSPSPSPSKSFARMLPASYEAKLIANDFSYSSNDTHQKKKYRAEIAHQIHIKWWRQVCVFYYHINLHLPYI